MNEQRPRRVSVTVREGPSTERRDEQMKDVMKDVFSCCDCKGAQCVHRRSLADTRLARPSWTKVADIPTEFLPFAMEKAVAGDSEREDMNKHLRDDNLDDFQRAAICLKSDHKAFAASNFDRFIKEDGGRAMSEVWPLMENELRGEEPDLEFHEAASRKFPVAIVELYKNGNGDGARELLKLIFDLIPSDQEEISGFWVHTLEKLVDACNSGDIQKDIFPTIVERFCGKHSSSNAKIGACRLLQKLAGRFNHEVIQKKLLPLVEHIARDNDPEVRRSAAICLPEMMHRTKNKDHALKVINIVSQDTDPRVRAAITSTIVQSISLMSDNIKDPRNRVYLESAMHAIKALVKRAYVNTNVELLVAYSAYMGRVCHAFSMAEVMKPRDVLWYLDAFLQLSRYDLKGSDAGNFDAEATMPVGFANFRANTEFTKRQSILESLISTKPLTQLEVVSASEAALNAARAVTSLRTCAEGKRMSIPYGGGSLALKTFCAKFCGPDCENAYQCRVNAAKEFYEFMLFAKPIVDFRHGLHPLVVDLMHDIRPEVRAAMAENILPIMEYLGLDAELLHGELVYGLTDDDLDVVQAIVPGLAKILKCLVDAKVLSPERITSRTVEIGGALLYCEERLNQTTFYMVHQTMLEQFSTLPFCLPGDYIYSNFVPALFHRLRRMRQMPCRLAAVDAIVIFLRNCRRGSQREDIRKRIKEDFARGHSVQDRMLFIAMAKKIMEKFSRKYFREYFFEDVLLLADDPVGNVRLKVMELLPELKTVSDDPNLHNTIEETFHKSRKSEVDRDVKAVIEETMTKLNLRKKTNNDLGGGGGKAKMLNAIENKTHDPEDEAKELEEAYIASLETILNKVTTTLSSKETRKSFFGMPHQNKSKIKLGAVMGKSSQTRQQKQSVGK